MSPIGEAAAMFTSLNKFVSLHFQLTMANSELPIHKSLKLSIQK